MRIIRAVRTVYVPLDPEKPDNTMFRPVYKGVLAIIPEDFNLPEDYVEELGKLDLDKTKKKKN